MASLIHASGSGYFPFCISGVGEVGANTNYPVGLSLSQAMSWYWKVRTWRLEWEYEERDEFNNVVASYSQDFTFSSHAQYAQSSLAGQVNIPQDFKELVCSAETSVGANPPPELSPLDFCGMVLFDDDLGNQPRIIKSGNLYYPRLRIGALLQGNPAPFSISSGQDGGTITIDGISVASFLLFPGATGVTATFSITPASYWSY